MCEARECCIIHRRHGEASPHKSSAARVVFTSTWREQTDVYNQRLQPGTRWRFRRPPPMFKPRSFYGKKRVTNDSRNKYKKQCIQWLSCVSACWWKSMLNSILCSLFIHTGNPLCGDMMESIKSRSQAVGLLGRRRCGYMYRIEILHIRNQAELCKVPSREKCVTSADLKANVVVLFRF